MNKTVQSKTSSSSQKSWKEGKFGDTHTHTHPGILDAQRCTQADSVKLSVRKLTDGMPGANFYHPWHTSFHTSQFIAGISHSPSRFVLILSLSSSRSLNFTLKLTNGLYLWVCVHGSASVGAKISNTCFVCTGSVFRFVFVQTAQWLFFFKSSAITIKRILFAQKIIIMRINMALLYIW